MASRLPTIGGDDGNWGTILNDYLGVALNTNGTLKNYFVNVKDYGATGDGSTDDASAIASAIAAVPTNGGVVYFPPGTYKHTTDITIRGQTVFLGAGRKATVIKSSGCHGFVFSGGNGNPGIILNSSCHSTIRDLSIQGDYTSGKVGLKLDHISDWAVEDISIFDFASYGVDLFWTVAMGFLNVIIRDNNSHGAHLLDAANAIVFGPGCHIKNNNGWGVYAEGFTGSGAEQTQVTDLRFDGTTIEGNLEGGIYAYQYVSMLTIDGCHLESNTQNNSTSQSGQTRPAVTPVRTIGRSVYIGNSAGISATAIQGVLISGCRLSSINTLTNSYHIDIEKANGVTVDGNAFYAATKSVYYTPAGTANFKFGLSNFENGDITRPNKNYLNGASTFNGTTGRTINLDWRSSGGTLYKVSILPTATMAGTWYVTKAGSSFTVFSTNSGDAGAFDWMILQEG